MKMIDKMQSIYNTGMTDRKACIYAGYSESHYSRIRKGEKSRAGNDLVLNDDAAEKISILYESRKDMPRVKVMNGWQKENTTRHFI